jgi:hypothetical protein
MGPLKLKQSNLVNVVMQVSLVNSHNMSISTMGLKTKRSTMSKREKATFEDCMENFETTKPYSPISGGVEAPEVEHLQNSDEHCPYQRALLYQQLSIC